MKTAGLALLMALSISVAFADEPTGDVRVWEGENSWSVIHAQVPGSLFGAECTLLWKPYLIDHALMWQWDGVALTAAFMAPAPAGMSPGPMNMDTTFVVSVDGRTIINWPAGHDVALSIEGFGTTAVVASRTVAWDHNDKQDDTQPETEAIFDILRHGRELTIQLYGKTYVEDLRGVDSGIQQLHACQHEIGG